MNQLHTPDCQATEAPPSDPVAPGERLQQIRLQGQRVSRAIGAAKKNNQDISELLEQRRLLSLQEQALTKPSQNEDTPAQQLATQQTSTGTPSPPQPEAQAPDNVEVVPLAQADVDAWDRYVGQHPQASSYHLSAWRQICHQAFGHTSHHLMAKRAGRTVGVLPLVQLQSVLFGNFLVSMPFLNYGGVLADDNGARQALLGQAVKLAGELGCSHMELRETSPSTTWPMKTDKVSMWLDLPDTPEALWSQLGSKLRAQIKKGLGHGLAFEIGGVKLLDDFYRVFSTNMRDLGTPVYAKRFFEIILNEAPGLPQLVVGRNAQGKPVAGALVLRHGQRMEVPWASTLRKANTLNANMALYWTMLSHACEAGCSTFDFGRSTVDATTHRFKKQWGAQAVPLYWHYWTADGQDVPQINPSNSKYRMAIAAWKRLPVALANQLGPHISMAIP